MDNDNISRLVSRIFPILIGIVVMGMFAARGCQKGPFGRTQIVQMSPEQEKALGAQAYHEILSRSPVLPGGPIVDEVRSIGRRLAEASRDPELRKKMGIRWPTNFDWEFNVVRDRQINAFCLPGGKVVVYTGILPVAESDAGLATVMGHEIGHALARHGAERMAQQQLAKIGQLALAVSVRDMDPQKQRMLLGAFGAGAQLGILLPYSREHEAEADHIGILLMARAGYDPREAARFWVRMSKATSGNKTAEFLSTHPSHERRIANLQNWLSEALPIYERSDKVRPSLLPLGS